ncbi:MAG: type II secretion system F family protein [Candidatus Eremiobacteraeota bacterium]|nr:type II secretion system F family protein [Candidatus Eremiobacteraeota bacterium]
MTFEIVLVLGGTLSAFLLGMSFIPGRNPLAKRIEKMQRVSETSHSARTKRFEEIIAAESQAKITDRLLAAGWYTVTPAALAFRSGAGLALGVVVGLALAIVLPVKVVAIVVGGMFALLGWRMPKIVLDRAIKTRQKAIERSLPDFLDLLSTTVQAGLALNAAMLQAAEAMTGPLQQELREALAEIRLGRSRADALTAMAKRADEPQMKSMVSWILQSEALGSNLAEVLKELALDARNRRFMLAEEKAGQLPIKMIFPMALLMLPSLYIMIFGPVVADVMRNR